MDSLIEMVRSANPTRDKKKISRRLLKLGEEYGEVVQAFLSVSSRRNSKNKHWPDVREELCDVLIIAVDILLTEMPDENYPENSRKEQIENRTLNEVSRKLDKWQHKKTKKYDERVTWEAMPSKE